VIPLDLVAV